MSPAWVKALLATLYAGSMLWRIQRELIGGVPDPLNLALCASLGLLTFRWAVEYGRIAVRAARREERQGRKPPHPKQTVRPPPTS